MLHYFWHLGEKAEHADHPQCAIFATCNLSHESTHLQALSNRKLGSAWHLFNMRPHGRKITAHQSALHLKLAAASGNTAPCVCDDCGSNF